MARIPHPHLLPENIFILRKRDRYRDATRFLRSVLVIFAILLFIFFLLASLVSSLKSIIPEPARLVCFGLSVLFFLVPGLISLWIWFRFRLPIYPVQTEYYGALKTNQSDALQRQDLSHPDGWEGFWESTLYDKAHLVWLNVVFWTMSLRRRKRDCNPSAGKETARGDLEAASGRHMPHITRALWGPQYRRPVEMRELPRTDLTQTDEAQISTHSQAVEVHIDEPGYGVRFKPWNIGSNPLLSDPWRLGLTDDRVTPAPGPKAAPLVCNGSGNKHPQIPSIRVGPAANSVLGHPTIDSQQKGFAAQDRTQRTKPVPFRKRFRVNPLFNLASGTKRPSSVHALKSGIMRRIRLPRPGVELYRRMVPTHGPSACLRRLASYNMGLLHPEAARFALGAGRKEPTIPGSM